MNLASKKKILSTAKNTILLEAEAIQNLVKSLNNGFIKCIEHIYNNKGKIIVTGIGKSAVIGMKIAATLNSTGTPSVFMHATDAIHGDLGIVQKDDCVICISKSGNSPEIKLLIPFIKKAAKSIISITSKSNSFLAKNSNFIIETPIPKEACPNNLAPTTSTAVQLAIGDAIAMCLLELNNFEAKDFAKYHPGGSLGRQLYLTTKEMISSDEKPSVSPDDSIKKVINEITSKRFGATAVINNKKIVGIITDGDIRRMLEKYEDLNQINASSIMTKNPINVQYNKLAMETLKLMEEKKINQIIVLDKTEYVGIVHILDFIKEGLYDERS
tara:strand:- start:1301 stop:2284 length:984 start_codon:yes stop_codon:yes gene_type:complete